MNVTFSKVAGLFYYKWYSSMGVFLHFLYLTNGTKSRNASLEN